jgi:hypothetical protein
MKNKFQRINKNFLLSEEIGKDRTIGLSDGGKHFGQFSGLKAKPLQNCGKLKN